MVDGCLWCGNDLEFGGGGDLGMERDDGIDRSLLGVRFDGKRKRQGDGGG